MSAFDERRITDALATNSTDLLAYFERRAGTSADAADLLAETMMTAWRRVSDLPSTPERARMWLFVIARHTLLNSERAERRRWRLANRLRLLLGPTEAPAADDGAEVRDAVARLDPPLAELIRLVHWDGFSLAEAAAVLEIPASTARGRYAKAKEELQRALGRSHPVDAEIAHAPH
ncbi:RNA polymerase subunit sigma-24 [Microbacterium sp. Gd 4-13]|uniref:RNA polymerase sigma factor n=1 Tax=Microbacterium sp. Gd 4-13 TaxID=2173179 RepID=UPI000D585C87|nr:RNA polymerase sigma factor [Microbacterium sp. Gd 4-13]PVW03037.1 RNA polymerase subunit sigma-24 [Microbacterium sp. Gd 4-13]